jgi:hypothetical protein
MKRRKSPPKRAKAARRIRGKAARAAGKAVRKPPRPVARRKAAAATARTRRKAAPRRPRLPLVQEQDSARQLADAVEAAQEDLRALPERPLFDPDRSGGDDDLAELLGEEYVRSVTSGEEQGVELRDQPVPEDEGGPFVESSAQREFAHGEDDAEPEALPTTRAPQTRKLR